MSVINTNVSAILTQNSLAKNERAMSGAMEQLSTGKRINSSADDAAGTSDRKPNDCSNQRIKSSSPERQ